MRYLIISIVLCISQQIQAQEPYFLTASPHKGEGIYAFLARYKLNDAQCNFDKFYELNDLSSQDPMILGKTYSLPLKIYSYNGHSIRSTIGNDDYDTALKIQEYNNKALQANLRKTDYRESNILWVPYQFLECTKSTIQENELVVPLFGKKYQTFERVDQSLESHVFYLSSGHGGPDPGAIGNYQGHDLCEDEYAYDVTLRLARNLMKHGAKVYIIVQDYDDGIRDEKILLCDKDEVVNGQAIPLNQLKRLEQRTEYINDLYYQNHQAGYENQVAVMIHVDSRAEDYKKDVFFMYYKNSRIGKRLASNLHYTFENKYKHYRSSGNYDGYIRTRDLYILRKTAPPAVFIELGNIRNAHDQKRILLSSNRQALADWIFEGLTRSREDETYVIN